MSASELALLRAVQELLKHQHAELVDRLHKIHEDGKQAADGQHRHVMRWTRWLFAVSILTAILAGIGAIASLQ